MPGRSVSPDRMRFGFNGQEKSPELSSGHTTAMFWEYDARGVQRWNIDPKPLFSLSMYAVFQGNPILYSDPFGDKVRIEKAKDVSAKEFREFKKDLKMARKHSESFREMYKSLKKEPKTIYTYVAVRGQTGGLKKDATSEKKDGTFDYVIDIPIDLSTSNKKFAFVGHETFHAYRQNLGLIPQTSELADKGFQDIYIDKNNTTAAAQQYVEEYVKNHQNEEKLAMHGENIVLSELKKSGIEHFKDFQLSETYLQFPFVKTTTTKKEGLFGTRTVTGYEVGRKIYTTMVAPVSKSYYLDNIKFDISTEARRSDLNAVEFKLNIKF